MENHQSEVHQKTGGVKCLKATGYFINTSDDRIVTNVKQITFQWKERNKWKKVKYYLDKEKTFKKFHFDGPLNPGKKSDTISFEICGYESRVPYSVKGFKGNDIKYRFKSIPYGGNEGKKIIIIK